MSALPEELQVDSLLPRGVVGMGVKAPTPKTDALRALREQRAAERRGRPREPKVVVSTSVQTATGSACGYGKGCVKPRGHDGRHKYA